MTDSRHQRIGDIVHAALELPPADRAALIDRECAGNDTLRAAVTSMLRAAHNLGSFLNEPVAGSETAAKLAELSLSMPISESGLLQPGERLGSVQILSLLGGGGMGEVYLAQQDQPKRRVALKIIRVAMSSQDTAARFRLEQQALATMAHPNIAQIFEVGCTSPERGERPYFTMEYVEGEPITAYCDRRAMTIRQRLELFIPVCEAVQHAHNRGIIHRDLKPSNVLVTAVEGRPVPKVIDFGIAKDIEQIAIERTVYSPERQPIGTPEYMSPEQASTSPDVDTRTDVYSLGVMLYDMLVGRLPFPSSQLRTKGLEEARRIIREENPPRPSTLFGAMGEDANRIASNRGYDRASMLRELRRELEWIPLLAIRKERDRRYPAPRELAEDIRRYLDGLPLWAAPESRMYLARKFVRRHRGSVAATIAVTAALAGATWGLGQAWAERAERIREGVRAEYDQYHASINSAQFALEDNDVATARLQLNRAPIELRGWEWNYLWAATGDSLRKLQADPRTMVQSIALSRDGTRAAIGLDSGVVLVWDWMIDREPRRLVGHSKEVSCVAFNQDATRLFSASPGATARIWDLARERDTFIPIGLAGDVDNAVFSSDGTRVIVACTSGTCQAFDSQSGHPLAPFGVHSRKSIGVGRTILSADGSRAATTSVDGSAEVWSTEGGQSLFTLGGRGHDGPPGIAVFSPDGRRVAHARDNHLCVCDATTGNDLMVMDGHDGAVSSLAFDVRGTRLVSASIDGTARVWSTSDPHALQVLRGHDSPVGQALFSSDGSLVLTASHDATLRLWSVDTGHELALLRGHESRLVNMAMSIDGAWALTSGMDQSVRTWDIRRAASSAALSAGTGNATAANFSPDGSRVVVPSAGNATNSAAVAIWSLRDGRRLFDLNGYAAHVWSAVYSPDRTRIVTASNDKTARIWDAATGGPILELRHDRWVNWASFSPDSAMVVTASGDKTARVWDAASGRELSRLDHPDMVRCAVYSPDGSCIATACDDGAVRIWDAASGRTIKTLTGHADPVICVSYSPTGRRLASSSANGTAKVWDPVTGDVCVELTGHVKHTMSVSFSPDESRIVTASWDKSVRVWDAASGREMAAFRDHHQEVNWAAFSPDGTHLLTTYQDGTVLVRDSVSAADRFAIPP